MCMWLGSNKAKIILRYLIPTPRHILDYHNTFYTWLKTKIYDVQSSVYLFFILFQITCLKSQSLWSCLRFTSSPIYFNIAAVCTSSLCWNSCVTNTPWFPRRTACKTYQDLCICIQSLLRWTQRWKCHKAGPFQTVSTDCLTNAYGFKVVICRHLRNAAAVWLSHGGAKRRFRVGNPSLESIHLDNCDIVTWEKHKGAWVTGGILMLKHWMRLWVSLCCLVINW